MAVHQSTQYARVEGTPPKVVKTNEWHGRVRARHFDFTVPTGDAAINDTVKLVKMFKGERILGGSLAFEAMSSGAGDASIQVGDGTTATKYLGTTSVDAAGKATFADTIALNYGEELAADTDLVATVITEAWAAGQKIKGHVLYLAD